MPISSTPDDATAHLLASQAGRLLQALRARARSTGLAAEQLRHQGDRLSHEFLVDQLRRLQPDDAILSEEGKDDGRRLTARRVWIIDPLDGTREFAECDRTDWAVHVALVEHGVPPCRGGRPSRPTAHMLDQIPAAVLATARWTPVRAGEPDPPAGRSRPRRRRHRRPGQAHGLGRRQDRGCHRRGGRRLRPLGGPTRMGPRRPRRRRGAAGLHASRLDGSPLQFNQPDPWLPDVLVCWPELAPPILTALAAGATGNRP